MRDEMIDYVGYWSGRTQIKALKIVKMIGLSVSKYYRWKKRYGMVNEHNHWIPRDCWLLGSEKEAIIKFCIEHPLEGYRRLTYMMIDAEVVAVSASSVYRVLKGAGLLHKWQAKPSRKGTGFHQPLQANEHWHVDISYLNIRGTFYYLCSILDGYSRYVVHWEIRESMREQDVAIIIQRAREKFVEVHPRIISDNGPQFIARDFKEFIRVCGMTHARTSVNYPQSNGKLERWHRSVKSECIRPKTPLSLDDARRVVADFVDHYNNVRLHSAIQYVTPKDKLAGRAEQIILERDRKLEAAREHRRRIRNRIGKCA